MGKKCGVSMKKCLRVKFEDFKNGEELPDRKTALTNLESGSCISSLFSNIKAALMQSGNSDGAELGRWKLLGKIKGDESIDLPDEFDELNIDIRYKFGDSDPYSNYQHSTFHILRAYLTDNPEYYEQGSYFYPKIYSGVCLLMDKTRIVNGGATFNSQDLTKISEVIIYYR